MPFDTQALIALACVWVFASYWAYVWVTDVEVGKRIWMDRTLPRRIFWIVLSPLFWLLVLVVLLSILTIEAGSGEWWIEARQSFAEWREKSKNRWERFLSNA